MGEGQGLPATFAVLGPARAPSKAVVSGVTDHSMRPTTKAANQGFGAAMVESLARASFKWAQRCCRPQSLGSRARAAAEREGHN